MSAPSIKKVNLDQIQRPKTLVVIHYKGKRVSIPLFDSVDNLTQYLWHQLQKFQATVLQKQDSNPNSKHRNSCSVNQIVSFTALQLQKNKLDIKMNILLSMGRLGRDYGRSRTDMKLLDITAYYKYLQIQPYYGFTAKQLIPQYQLFSVLNTGNYFTTYLGRKMSDGRFYSIKMCRADSKLAQNQYHAMKAIHHEQSQFDDKNQLELILQIQQIRKHQGLYIYVCEYLPGGNLRTMLKKKLNEIECLHYMKQLVWGIHTLHSHFNLIHRALCFENIEVDFVGNLRLVNFAYCQPCYANNYLVHSNVPESYDQNYEIQHVLTPPQVHRSARYNNLVDYFGVGAVLYEMFTANQGSSNRNQKEGIEIAIQNLMAENIRHRQMFANQVIAELHQQKMKLYSSKSISSTSSQNNRDRKKQVIEHERLTFKQIYTGQSINLEDKVHNGIRHEDALKIMKPSYDDQLYYLNPVNKSRKKSKNKSKDKSKEKSLDKNKQKKSKSKSKQRKDVTNKSKPSNSNADSLNAAKIIKNASEKSLNKSIDSRNNSVKSNKSNESKKKTKPPQHPSMGTIGTLLKPAMMPKIPTSPTAIKMKSPPKNNFNHTSTAVNHQNHKVHYPNQAHEPHYTRTGQSPPKIITSKSKNRL